ncbi:MAG TPA: hypothetical protein VJ813_14620 [Vicinamibacterales bacterium]|nr:hypothetical protein [Vicinamibacterales bacterium]
MSQAAGLRAGWPAARRRELMVCIGVALALVTLRSAVSVLWERAFDSDQAIIGLMAKHLSEFTTFPLFFYGQNYMLGVQSWIAVPFFWIGGPTVAMLRLPLLLINGAVAAALILIFSRLGIRPLLALVAVLPLAATTPVVSGALVETIGASIEPFAYVLILWALRRRPGWWGPIFCLAVLHREFTLFAAPAMVVAQWRERQWWTAAGAGRAAAGFAAMWILIDVLKRTLNAYGPPGGDHASSSLVLEAQQILMWLSFDLQPYLARTGQVLLEALPDMMGARSHTLASYGLFSAISAGSLLAGIALALASAVAVWRIPTLMRKTAPEAREDALMLYLALIGLQAMLAYGLNSGISATDPPVVRYLLFTLLLPVALLAWFFLRERARTLRAVVAVSIVLWAAGNVVDTSRLLREYLQSPPPNPHREMADYLVERGIRFGRAGYWDAYVITFLARERVILASTGKVRISAYQSRVDQHGWEVVVLTRQPCTSATRIAAWCIDGPE